MASRKQFFPYPNDFQKEKLKDGDILHPVSTDIKNKVSIEGAVIVGGISARKQTVKGLIELSQGLKDVVLNAARLLEKKMELSES